MDGIHDLGGMSGFGPVEVERGEPVFHERWEAIAFALNALGIAVLTEYNADEYRHAIERMDPSHYLAATYYERVLTGVATLLVEKGVVTREELERRAGGPFPLARPVAENPTVEQRPQPSARFAVGSTVRDSRTTRERYARSLYQSGGRPMTVNAVHEHSVQQMTFCTVGVFSSTTRWR
jgi:nitrile hydratase